MLVVANERALGVGGERRLPVPDRPKKMAERPSSPTFAEQCIGSTSSSGSLSFMTVKTDFLISPA